MFMYFCVACSVARQSGLSTAQIEEIINIVNTGSAQINLNPVNPTISVQVVTTCPTFVPASERQFSWDLYLEI